MEKRDGKKYSFILIFLILLAASFLIIKDYIVTLLASIIFAYMFYPVYKKILSKTNNVFAALTTILIILLILILPLIFIANSLIKESIQIYQSDILTKINEFVTDFSVKYISSTIATEEYFTKIVDYGLNFLRTTSINFIINLPSKILDFFIFIFSLFYLFIYGESYVNKFKKLILLKEKEHLINHVADKIYSIVYGTFLLALIEFAVASIGFYILGIKAPIIWGIVVGVLAFIPLLGPTIVWVPFAVLKLVEGNVTIAISILILGLLLSFIDTIIRTKILSDRSKINPIIMFVGVLGGIELFGIIGIIVGPITLSLFIEVMHLYLSKWN